MKGNPIDTRDHTGHRTAARAVEYANGNEFHVLRDTICRSAHGTRNVRAVAVAVDRRASAGDLVDPGERATCVFIVGEIDAGVDDIDGDTRAVSEVGVRAAQRKIALIDPIDPPCRPGLNRAQLHDRVLLDLSHIGVGLERQHGGIGDPQRHTLQRGGIRPLDGRAVQPFDALSAARDISLGVLESDDILAGNRYGRVLRSREAERRTAGAGPRCCGNVGASGEPTERDGEHQ